MDVSGYIDHGGMYGGMEGLEGLEVDDGWVGGKNEEKMTSPGLLHPLSSYICSNRT